MIHIVTAENRKLYEKEMLDRGVIGLARSAFALFLGHLQRELNERVL
jgi:hypothetical protein